MSPRNDHCLISPTIDWWIERVVFPIVGAGVTGLLIRIALWLIR